jgi:hypothetical protein
VLGKEQAKLGQFGAVVSILQRLAMLQFGHRNIERRAVPRKDPIESLGRWLEICRKIVGLQALALSDDRGCLIAGAGASRVCDELAALAPAQLVLAPIAKGTNSIAVGRGRAYLCAPAGLLEQEPLSQIARVCSRILEL